MSAEEFLEEKEFYGCLRLDDALKAVNIAKKEIANKIYEYLCDNKNDIQNINKYIADIININ